MIADTAKDFFPAADGCIIGSALKVTDPETLKPVVSVGKTMAFLKAMANAQLKGRS